MTHDSHVAKTATVKNLFDAGLAGDTKQRIMELHHHSQRLWGNMTVAQTMETWSVCETLISVTALILTWALSMAG